MHTLFFKDFKNLIGPSIHNLNTICVGLEQIINGHYQKPTTLTITWSSRDPINDAKRARRYTVNIFFISAVDAIESYIKSICTIDKLIPAKTIEKIRTSNGNREKIKQIFEIIKNNNVYKEYWVPIIRIVIGWRNIIIHRSKAKIILDTNDKKILTDNKDEIYKLHSKTDITQTLGRYERKEYPTLKDFSTLFTIMLNAFRELDRQISQNISIDCTATMICEKVASKEILNKLTRDNMSTRRIKQFCKTNSIPFASEDSLTKVINNIRAKSTVPKLCPKLTKKA